ncbi:hypothetical protein OROGR_007881 [Orobanche gracilis]
MMRRNYGPSFRNSGAYTSPGTPVYGNDINNDEDMPKTWSSERIPLPTSSSSSSTRHISATALVPFNSGRALPSKWDDAERWITSPISGYGAFKNSIARTHQRQPKSKSGPLGPTGLVYLPNHPNALPNARSPLTTGVLASDVSYGGAVDVKSSSLYGESSRSNNNITRSTSVPGLSDLVSGSFVASSQEVYLNTQEGGICEYDKLDGSNEDEVRVSLRDMATQMSPETSTRSSSRGVSFSNLPSLIRDLEHARENKDDVRDVQVDKGTTTSSRLSKKKGLQKMGSDIIENLPSSWNAVEASKNISKLQRAEAKITAWENLQKAKAEAAIRELEMKLERKRSASMEKITNKLRAAQIRAQATRDLLSDQAAPGNPHKGFSFCIYVRICNCFVCNKS